MKDRKDASKITRRHFIMVATSAVLSLGLFTLGLGIAAQEERPSLASQDTFCTSIACIDGRVQRPVYDYLRELCQVNFVDMITVPGPDKVLSEGGAMTEFIRTEVSISVEKHGSKAVAIAGHHDCKANSVSKEEHWSEIQEAVKKIRSWNLPVSVIGLWVDENWKVEVVPEKP